MISTASRFRQIEHLCFNFFPAAGALAAPSKKRSCPGSKSRQSRRRLSKALYAGASRLRLMHSRLRILRRSACSALTVRRLGSTSSIRTLEAVSAMLPPLFWLPVARPQHYASGTLLLARARTRLAHHFKPTQFILLKIIHFRPVKLSPSLFGAKQFTFHDLLNVRFAETVDGQCVVSRLRNQPPWFRARNTKPPKT
jgi:hypothetical protein